MPVLTKKLVTNQHKYMFSGIVQIRDHHASKAKYMIPRSPNLQTAYRSSKQQRPKMKIHGLWSFGYVLRIAVLEEKTYHGSSLVQELLALALEDIMTISNEKQVAAPDTLVLVGDNTVKELKNSILFSGAANLVNHSRLRFLPTKFSPDFDSSLVPLVTLLLGFVNHGFYFKFKTHQAKVLRLDDVQGQSYS